MKNKTFLFSLFLFLSFQVIAQVDISRIFKNSTQITSRATSFAQDAIDLEADLSYINKVYNEKNEYISLTVPVSKNEEVTLQLERFSVLSKNVIIRTSSGDTLENIDPGIFYRGPIKDRDGFATVSIFKDRIWSIVSIKGVGSINIVKYKDSDYRYIVYNAQKVNTPQSFECHTPDDIVVQDKNQLDNSVEFRSDNCVKFYIEADYELYQDRGSVQNTKDWITVIFAEVSALYKNENINIEISEIKVWDTPDSYSNDDSNDALNQFKDENRNFNGDLASLYSLGGNNIGGLAWTDILCNRRYSYAYMNVFTDYQSVPTYSWTVEVITHETGHNMGSRHTHACVWNGNNTQIDDCGNQYYFEIEETPEGEMCFDSNNPILPPKGTIMSYCHLIDGVGIDFNLGFGKQPGDLIRNRYNDAYCLTACTEEQGNAPNADFESDLQEICLGQEVSFYDLSTENPTKWEWVFEGGTPDTSSKKQPFVTYNKSGVYGVTLTVRNPNGYGREIKQGYITVHQVPSASFTYDIINDKEVHFINTSQFSDNYEWSFGDNTYSTDKNPVHIYQKVGTYDVTLYAYNQQCEKEAYYQLQIEIKDVELVAKMSYDTDKLCKGGKVNFYDSTAYSAQRYWIFEGGNPETSTSHNPVVTYNLPGVYDVTLFVHNGSDTDTLVKYNLIQVNDLPVANFVYTVNGNIVEFSNTSTGADSYKWDFGNGHVSNDKNPTHEYNDSGDYNVTLTASNECGDTTKTITVSISIEPVAKFSVQDSIGCAPLEVQFNNLSSSSSSWIWLFEGGIPDVSIEENPLVSYTVGGKYDVKLIAIGDNGQDTIIVEDYIIVDAEPTVDFSYNVDEAKVEFHNLSSDDAGDFYWDFGDGIIVNEENPVHVYEHEGKFNVKLIASNDCGENSVTKEIEVIISKLVEESFIKAKLYPNPNNGNFTVNFNSTYGGEFKTRIFNTNGQLLYDNSIDISIGENKLDFDVQTLNSGIYILELSNNNFNYKVLFNIE